MATVDAKGNVKAVNAGTATITATLGKVSATFTVTVKNPSITAKADSSVIYTKSKTTTKINVVKDGVTGNATFRSSNKKVATVSANGTVKAKKAGKELSVEEAQLLAAAAEDEEAAMKEQARLREIPRELAVYEITGPLFFGAADRINQIETREETKCLVLRMRAVPAVDSTAMNSMVALYERCQKNGVTLILSHVNEQPMHVMEKAGFVDMIGRDHFCPNIEAALDHADEVLRK